MDLKVATFNAEWMYSFFERNKAKILNNFPGGSLGSIQLEPIEDVKALCKKIGDMLDEIDADVIGIVEGPQLKEQMDLFVKKYMKGAYDVYTQSRQMQNIHVLVRKGLEDVGVTQFDYEGPDIQLLRKYYYYNPWGKISEDDIKRTRMTRTPVVVELSKDDRRIIFVTVHTKSKFSKLRARQQWFDRDEEAVLDALEARQKLSVHVVVLRAFVDRQLRMSQDSPALVVMGDINDGPFRDVMEADFLIHNILDEIQGSLLDPNLRLFHSMPTATLAEAYSTRFEDPFAEGSITSVLIDHILVSRNIAEGTSGVAVQPGSPKVEHDAYNANNDETDDVRARHLRPSDHIPGSAVLEL